MCSSLHQAQTAHSQIVSIVHYESVRDFVTTNYLLLEETFDVSNCDHC